MVRLPEGQMTFNSGRSKTETTSIRQKYPSLGISYWNCESQNISKMMWIKLPIWYRLYSLYRIPISIFYNNQFSSLHVMLWLSILYSTSSFGPNPFFTYLIFCILGGPLRFIVSYITLKFARRKGIILCSTLTCILLILSQGLRLYGEFDIR